MPTCIAPGPAALLPALLARAFGAVAALGDLLLIATTGAHGASMASTCNSRPLSAEVMVDDGRYAIVRQRQTFAEMVAAEPLALVWDTT